MADMIQLLPDDIANQIAAGEVIQRPASVVKELMENAIDAGATSIKLIVKDAGKALIQVIDNGCGMSETDARMSFERHATSKIRNANDLFAIRTMGFRGEALASIAAIAQLEMRTKQASEELGTKIAIEASEVKIQEPCQCTAGTNISVKNLFFNVPARRKFLKSNTVEMRHIMDEFQRIAIANPDVFFSLHHNNTELFHLPAGNLRQRVIGILGSNYNKRLVPVSEETDVLRLEGFVGKPEFAKKTRGDQFFFVNQRFIKSAYLHHAVSTAYEELLPKETFPLYVIFVEIDPNKIDINVHPTKQEIKFDDERLVYNYLRVAVRHALGQYSIMPSLDFDQEISFSQLSTPSRKADTRSTEYFPKKQSSTIIGANNSKNLEHWEKLYKGMEAYAEELKAQSNEEEEEEESSPFTIGSKLNEDTDTSSQLSLGIRPQKTPFQVHNTYIISQIKSGFLLIDQQAAHERILYEQYLEILKNRTASTQKELFPRTLSLPPADAEVLREILATINLLGFDVQEFGSNTFVINGLPSELVGNTDETEIIDSLLEQYKSNMDMKLGIEENIARSMAKSAAKKKGQSLSEEEMQTLIDKLFACSIPYKSPTGRNCFITFDLDELEKRFSS